MVIRSAFTKTISGGIGMKSENLWQAFLDTGAPELYLLYAEAKKAEETDVFKSSGVGITCDQLQRS